MSKLPPETQTLETEAARAANARRLATKWIDFGHPGGMAGSEMPLNPAIRDALIDNITRNLLQGTKK